MQIVNTQVDTNTYSVLSNVTASLQKIRSTLDSESPIIESVLLITHYFNTSSNNTISLVFSHPQDTIYDAMLVIHYTFIKQIQTVKGTWYGTNTKGTYEAKDGWVNIKLAAVYSGSRM